MSSTATSRALNSESIAPDQTSFTRSSQTPLGEGEQSAQQKIELLAYDLWLKRGQPEGSPECDWLEAERQLQLRANGEP